MGSACSSPKVDDNVLVTDKNVYSRMCWSTCIDHSAGILFEVKAAAEAKVGLFNSETVDAPFVELVLGSKENTCTSVVTGQTVVHSQTSETLDDDQFRTFWITWVDGAVKIGRGCIPGVSELANFASTNGSGSAVHVVKVTTLAGPGIWRNPRLIDRTHLEGLGHPDQFYNPPLLKTDCQAQVHSNADAADLNDPAFQTKTCTGPDVPIRIGRSQLGSSTVEAPNRQGLISCSPPLSAPMTSRGFYLAGAISSCWFPGFPNDSPALPQNHTTSVMRANLLLCLCACAVGAIAATEEKSGGSPSILTEQLCTDDNPRCPSWKEFGHCRSHPSYMLRYCRLSCGLCKGSPSISVRP